LKENAMTQERQLDNELLNAAITLLVAKEQDMLTPREWADLRMATARLQAHRDRLQLQEPIAGGTQVLHTEDGEIGGIMNGYAFDPTTGEWTEYEVETAAGIERWERSAFVLMSEIENNV
jgi:hypothetical protein